MARADATVNEVRSCLWVEIGEFVFVSKFFFFFTIAINGVISECEARSSKMDCVRENVEDRDAGRRWEVLSNTR